jgi:hypothetical protein
LVSGSLEKEEGRLSAASKQNGSNIGLKVILENINIFAMCNFLSDRTTRFLTSGFFHESISPSPMSIPLGCFLSFDTGGTCKNLQSEKF